jgi:hypothetical protein
MRRDDPGGRQTARPTEPQVGIEPTTAPLSRTFGSRISRANRNQKQINLRAGNPQPLLYEGRFPRNRNRNAIFVFGGVFRESLLKIGRLRRWFERQNPAADAHSPLPRGSFRRFAEWLRSERYLRAEVRRARRIRTRQLNSRELAEVRSFMRPRGAA